MGFDEPMSIMFTVWILTIRFLLRATKALILMVVVTGSYSDCTSVKHDWKFHSQPALTQHSLARLILCRCARLEALRTDLFEKMIHQRSQLNNQSRRRQDIPRQYAKFTRQLKLSSAITPIRLAVY
jgi:hypothetical protein